MNVKTIVQQYLKANGYDGLWNPDGECSCEVGDLWPCEYPNGDCMAGHYVECPGDGCEGMGMPHYHIGTRQAEKETKKGGDMRQRAELEQLQQENAALKARIAELEGVLPDPSRPKIYNYEIRLHNDDREKFIALVIGHLSPPFGKGENVFAEIRKRLIGEGRGA